LRSFTSPAALGSSQSPIGSAAGDAVEGALRRHDLVVSSDPDDLTGIATAVGRRLEVERP